MSRQSLVMAAPLGKPDKRVRLAKTIALLHEDYACDIHFWGWQRLETETLGANLSGVTSSKILVKGGGYRSRMARGLYLYWMLRVFWATLFKPAALGPIYCLGLETALPVWFASRLRRDIKYIFDDADRLVLIWNLPRPIERFLIFFEKKISRDSHSHIIPSHARYNYKTDKQYEIKNSPNQAQIVTARKSPARQHGAALNVYVNGWLDPTRGLALIDAAADILTARGNTDIQFNVAVGNLTDKNTSFFSRSNVNHLGSLTHIDSLKQYGVNDVVVTFYDPTIRINQYAIPNKWGDAVAMTTPIIVNEGVKTAQHLHDVGAAFEVPFQSPEALADLLVMLSKHPEKLKQARIAIQKLGPEYQPFNEMMAPVLERFLITSPS